ncbi:MAG: hypothetical protein HY880_07415, partial [Deltaproteobacteria bacterium]|nr:hypothetical protein [Deltaproteobacteria bacterium]
KIEFFDAALRHYPSLDKVVLERFDFIDIVSLAERDEFFKPLSWKVLTGFSRKTFRDAKDHSVYLLNPGAGFAYNVEPFGLLWAMFETELDVSGGMDESFSAGGGVSLGLLKDFMGSMALTARAIYYGLGDEHRLYEARFSESFELSRNQSLRIEVSGEKSFGVNRTEVMLGWNLYF